MSGFCCSRNPVHGDSAWGPPPDAGPTPSDRDRTLAGSEAEAANRRNTRLLSASRAGAVTLPRDRYKRFRDRITFLRGRPVQVSPVETVFLALSFSSDGPAAAWLHRPQPLLHDLAHAGKSLLNLGPVGHFSGREFMPAQPTHQIGPEVQLPQPDLEQLPAAGTGQIDPGAPMILEQVASSVAGSFARLEAWQYGDNEAPAMGSRF